MNSYKDYLIIGLLLMLFANDSFAQAPMNIDSLKAVAANQQSLEKANTLKHIVFELHHKAPEQALYYAKEIIKIAEKEGNEFPFVYNFCGDIETTLGHPEEAEKYYLKALESSKGEYLVEKTGAYVGLGHICWSKGDFRGAIHYHLKALKLADSLKNTGALASINNQLGTDYQSLGDTIRAIYYFEQTLLYLKGEKEKGRIAIALNNLGTMYRNTGNYDKALDYFEKAIEGFKAENRMQGLATVYRNIGTVYENQEKYAEAIGYYKKSIRIIRKVEATYDLIMLYSDLGMVYLKNNELSKAEEYTVKSLNLSRELEAKKGESMALYNLASVYEKKKEHQLAFESMKAYTKLSGQIINEQKIAAIEEMQAKYQSEKKEKEIELLNKENEVKSLELERQTTLKKSLIGIFALTFLLVLVTYNRYQLQRKTSKRLAAQKKEIEHKKEEKEILLRELQHRVKNNLQIISSLFDLQFSEVQSTETQKSIQELKNRIHSMAIVHQKLYRDQDLASIAFDEYVKSLCENLYHSYGMDQKRVQLRTQLQKVQLDIDAAISLGLIINEMITNVLKYAFPDDRAGVLDIVLQIINGKDLELTVQDNGVGIPKKLNIDELNSSGMQLAQALTEELKGTLKIEYQQGTKVQIDIPDFEPLKN